jgi:hypothetical protein
MGKAAINPPNNLPHILWFRRVCPLCSSFRFESAELGPLDGFLGLFSLRPVRCTNCWRRYYWFARGSVSSGPTTS